jgi:hypothetical protein
MASDKWRVTILRYAQDMVAGCGWQVMSNQVMFEAMTEEEGEKFPVV